MTRPGSTVLARRVLSALCVSTVATAAIPTAQAHSGTTHAGTPHWVLFALVAVGIIGAGLSALAARRGVLGGRGAIVGVFAGGILAMVGGIGLVELQVVAASGPQFGELYGPVAFLTGSAIMLGSLVAGWYYWHDRPRYMALGAVLGAWVMYPAVMPNNGITHPLGYALVFAFPVAVGRIIQQDARTLLMRIRRNQLASRTALAASGLFAVFFAFSAGTLSLNPDTVPSMDTTRKVVVVPLTDPLVSWPAVEFYFPSVPLAGFVSIGTVILVGVLATLVGLNAGYVADRWTRANDETADSAFAGSLAASGATACCCCAPAMYGVLSAVFGAAATPVYWAFMDPTSPVGGLFLTVSVLLLVATLVRSSDRRPVQSSASAGVPSSSD